MNDLEEVRFGISEGLTAFMASPALEAACQTPQRAALLRQHFDFYFRNFDREHVLDTYVFCLSEHDRGDDDGLLSMWRGYAANGNGAAIGFDTGQLIARENTPLIIARVAGYPISIPRLVRPRAKNDQSSSSRASATISSSRQT